MPTARGESYAASSGAVVAGGHAWANPVPATVAFIGDSLTDPSYNVSPWYWALGVNDAPLAPIINAGVSGNTIAQLLARIDNAYTHASPGLASAPQALGWVFIRIGTNDAHNGAINGTIQANFDSLLAKCLSYGLRAVIAAIPPLGGAEAAKNANVPGYNAFFASKANGSTVFFIDGTSALKDGGGAQIGSYFSDGIHFNPAGVLRVGLDEGVALASIVSGYASPVDPAATSGSTQWHPNPLNAGTGGSLGGGYTGQLPSNHSIGSYGSCAAACSIVAADGGDSNGTPWLRIAPSSLGAAGNAIRLSLTPAGRSISSSDPGALDVVVEVRFNALDATRFTDLRTWIQCSGTNNRLIGSGANSGDLMLHLGGISSLTQTAVLRTKLKRATASAESAPTLYIDLRSAGSYSGAMGSIDMRCFTIKG